MLNKFRIIIISGLLIASCKGKEKQEIPQDGKTYFSIIQFIDDQMQTFKNQPFGIQKIVTLNGKTDSTLTDVYKMAWGPVLKPFFESDISDPKFLGRYNFSTFKDDATFTINLYYEAKEAKLFTRKLMISIDDMTAKVKSIYIETEGNGVTRKLFYVPIKTISIQEMEKSGPVAKDLKVEYHFLS